MSGTSMDGVDASLARIILTERRFEFEVLDSKTFPFDPDTKKAIAAGLTGNSDQLAALHFRLGKSYAQVATNFLGGRSVDLVGCHGQTVAHRDREFTLQLGSPAPLARALGAPVVSGFREADLAAGGNGAPLPPAATSASRKPDTTGARNSRASGAGLPSCRVNSRSRWATVWPWQPTRSTGQPPKKLVATRA